MNIDNALKNSAFLPLDREKAIEISNWEYPAPYEAYSFKGHPNGWLMNEATWGTEQFCLTADGVIWGQVSCQFDGGDLWVGWAMAPEFCGKGHGAEFAERCVRELCRLKNHSGRILLRVSARNQRAIKAYRNAGFTYVETVTDEIAYSGNPEDFWIMQFGER